MPGPPRATGMKVLALEAQTAQDVETAFATLSRERNEAMIVSRDTLLSQQGRQIAERAVELRLPLASGNRETAEAGGLLSYGPNRADPYRRVAMYADRIFKGAKPGELPIEQPTQFELVINGKTAKALGLTIPQSLLISADKVIE